MRRMRFAGVPFVLFAIVFVAALGLVVSTLWNLLMPAILHLPVISYWQALGLLVLSRVLFGRFGGGWGSRMRGARFARGWNDLSLEERDRFSRAMEGRRGGRCGGEGMAEKL